MKTRYQAVLGVLVMVALSSGCTKDVYTRGNLPPPDAIAQLSVGEQTQQDVRNLLGTPAATAIFDDGTWYYISGHTTQYAFYPNYELDRTVYVIAFDERGILKDVRKLGLEDGRSVAIASRETPTKGREYGVLEQLLGNIGRIGGPPPVRGPQ